MNGKLKHSIKTYLWSISCLPLCQSSIAVLSSSPTKSLEDCKQDVYVILLGKLLSYTSPYPMHHILTHRSTSCANAPVHACVQMHKMHTSASTLCLIESCSKLLCKLCPSTYWNCLSSYLSTPWNFHLLDRAYTFTPYIFVPVTSS